MQPGPAPHPKLIRRLITSVLPVVVVVSLFTSLLEYAGWLHGTEARARDALLVLRGGREKPLPNCAIVAITDDDVKRFGNHFPLNAKDVKDLLRKIIAGQPKLVAVDLDTSLWEGKDLDGLPDKPPIVWATAVRYPANEETEMKPIPPLGGKVNLRSAQIGLAVLPVDSDGIYRRHQRWRLAKLTAPSPVGGGV